MVDCVAAVFFPVLLGFFAWRSLLALVTLPARVTIPDSLLLVLARKRPLCDPLAFFAAFSLESRDSGLRSPSALDFDSFVAFFVFGRGLLGTFLSLGSDVLLVLRFFFVVSSITPGEGKNRERDGNWKSSEGEGMGGGVAAGGEIPNSLSGSYAPCVGVRDGGLGEEDRTITSAELAMMANGAFRLLNGLA